MNAQDTPRTFDIQTIVNVLKDLHEEVDRESKTCITKMIAPFPVVLWDVCNALGLSQQECDEVLGRSATFVRAWLKCDTERQAPDCR
jgi:hypothetical protein